MKSLLAIIILLSISFNAHSETPIKKYCKKIQNLTYFLVEKYNTLDEIPLMELTIEQFEEQEHTNKSILEHSTILRNLCPEWIIKSK